MSISRKEKAEELNLEFNQKTQIMPISEGVDFLGFRFYLTDTGKVIRRLRTSNKRRWKRRLKSIKKSTVSERKALKRSGDALRATMGIRQRNPVPFYGDICEKTHAVGGFGRESFQDTENG